MKRILLIKGMFFAGLLLVAFTFSQCTFNRHAKRSYIEAKNDAPYDVIIVPGSPYLYGSVSNVMKMRVFWAKHLYDMGYARNIIFSGSSVYSPYVEGIVMKIMADSLGIPPEHTFAETRAEHSTENVYYSWKMAQSMGFKRIALATDQFQNKMLKKFNAKYCPDVKAVPIIFGKMNFRSKVLPKIDSSSAYVEDFVSIVKRESFWERFRGTRGKRIIFEIEASQKQLETAKVDVQEAAMDN